MTRIALLLLTLGAFVYAVWLVVRGKPLPQPAGTRGLKRRFLLATLLFAGLLSQVVGGPSAAPQDPAGSDPNAPSHVVAAEDLWVTIKTVWRTLDPNQAEVFRQHLETAVADGQVRQRVADILSTAFTQIAAQNELTPLHVASPPAPDPAPTPTPTPRPPIIRSLQDGVESPSARALREIGDLRRTQEAGRLNESFCVSLYSILAKDIEMMWLLDRTKPDEQMTLDSLWQRYATVATSTAPIDSSVVAAKIIVESEGGTLSSVTPASRLQTMRNRVDDLLYIGPVFSDWRTGGVSPRIEDMLEGLGLVEFRRHVTCYRSQTRVDERTAELKDLQAALLQKCVDANVIDEQVAAWAADPNGADPNAIDSHAVLLPLDFAIEAEMRAFQKQIRCVMMELYNRGEVPSSFVRDMELAADIEILPVDSIEARRRDMSYFLHALLDCPSKEPFVTALEDRGLIPPAQNHRMVTYNYNPSCEADPDEDRVLEFISWLDDGAEVSLQNDQYHIWPASLLPSEDVDYRMTMRRVCRLLARLGYADSQWLTAAEQAIGIPVVATISEEATEITVIQPPEPPR